MVTLLNFIVSQTGLLEPQMASQAQKPGVVFPQRFRKENGIIPSNWDLEICNKGKTWWCPVVGSAHSRFRPPATGLKIARRQAADVKQSARRGEAMAFLDDLEAGREMIGELVNKREDSPSHETIAQKLKERVSFTTVLMRDLDSSPRLDRHAWQITWRKLTSNGWQQTWLA